MENYDNVNNIFQQHSSAVVRQFSALIGGSSLTAEAAISSVPILSQPQEGAPVVRQPSQQLSTAQVRQPSRRGLNEDQTVQQLQETVQNGMRRYQWALCLVLLSLSGLIICGFVFLLLALGAVLNDYDKDCDRPLKWYLLTSLMFGHMQPRLFVAGTQHFPVFQRHSVLWAVITFLPNWGIVGWGLYMVQTTKTCPQTNPDLFYPTQRFIYFQIIMTFVLLAFSVVGACGIRRMLPLINRLFAQPGCERSVHQFPKIRAGSPDLISEEDGTVLACPICLDSLSEGGIRTPCSHIYHEECLATWCKSKTTCPSCRAQLAEPDP